MRRIQIPILAFFVLVGGCQRIQYPKIVAVDAHTGLRLTESTATPISTYRTPTSLTHRMRFEHANPTTESSNWRGEVQVEGITSSHLLTVDSDGYQSRQFDNPWLLVFNPLGKLGVNNQPVLRNGRLEVPLLPAAEDETFLRSSIVITDPDDLPNHLGEIVTIRGVQSRSKIPQVWGIKVDGNYSLSDKLVEFSGRLTSYEVTQEDVDEYLAAQQVVSTSSSRPSVGTHFSVRHPETFELVKTKQVSEQVEDFR